MAVEMGFPETAMLCATAFTVGTVHTLLGPDHYVRPGPATGQPPARSG